MRRWERMYQVFELLEGNSLTVRELTDILEMGDESITLNLVDFLLRHYNKRGYLTRYKENGKYSYSLSNNGERQLEWLKSGDYENYLELYEYIND